jgi:hypothetical protein
VTKKWIKLHNDELHNSYSSPDVIRMIRLRMRWARHAACIRELRNAHTILVGKPEVKTPLTRPGCR